jgi:hypothetical protein
MPANGTYRALDPQKVIDTIAALEKRIAERFPGAGLASVCAELLAIARENSARARRISRPSHLLRLGIFVLVIVGAGGLLWIASLFQSVPATTDNVFSVLQGLEAAANLTVLVGAGLFFLVRLEERLKRARALTALHEVRSIVHVIDMHQLTKDPSAGVSIGGSTPSSPRRELSPYELTRYLDYCSEMLSLTAKVAVLFAQGFPDSEVTETVSDIERIAAGLSQKIWQKIMIFETLGIEAERRPGAIVPARSGAPEAQGEAWAPRPDAVGSS